MFRQNTQATMYDGVNWVEIWQNLLPLPSDQNLLYPGDQSSRFHWNVANLYQNTRRHVPVRRQPLRAPQTTQTAEFLDVTAADTNSILWVARWTGDTHTHSRSEYVFQQKVWKVFQVLSLIVSVTVTASKTIVKFITVTRDWTDKEKRPIIQALSCESSQE